MCAGDETKSTVSETWSTDVLASDSEPPDLNQLERLEELVEEDNNPAPPGGARGPHNLLLVGGGGGVGGGMQEVSVHTFFFFFKFDMLLVQFVTSKHFK